MLSTERLIAPADHDEILHIGALCRRIRESRGLDAAQLVRWCGVRHTSNITRNFEEQGMTSDTTFERYVEALCMPALAAPPLMQRQAAMLHALWRNRKQTGQIQRNLAAITFEQIIPHKRFDQAAACLAALEQIGRPAWIMDDLWFIHALNGALLQLFGIDPHRSAFLHSWSAWHVIASTFCANSPVRQSYAQADLVLPPAIVAFLEDTRTYPLLFTAQMRKLIARIITLSEQEGCEFQHWWRQARACYLPYSLTSLARTIIYQGQPIYAEPRIHTTHTIALGAEHAARYTIVVWNPVDRDAEAAFEQIRSTPGSHAIIYAAEYDRHNDFHANDWPEVRNELDSWLQC